MHGPRSHGIRPPSKLPGEPQPKLKMPTPPSQIADPAADASVFWYRFRRELALAFLIVLLGAIGWSAWQLYSNHQNEVAAGALATAKSIPDLQKVVADYGNTPAGASANLLIAEKQRLEGKFSDANNTLQNFIDKSPRHELVPAAKMAMAANLQSEKKTDEALALYKQIGASYPKSFVAPLALISQVPLLKEKNQPDAARRACETVISQYGQSFWAGEAMRELRTLKPAATAAPSGLPAASAAPAVSATPNSSAVPGEEESLVRGTLQRQLRLLTEFGAACRLYRRRLVLATWRDKRTAATEASRSTRQPATRKHGRSSSVAGILTAATEQPTRLPPQSLQPQRQLALGELETLARARLPGLLAFLHPRIAAKQAFSF